MAVLTNTSNKVTATHQTSAGPPAACLPSAMSRGFIFTAGKGSSSSSSSSLQGPPSIPPRARSGCAPRSSAQPGPQRAHAALEQGTATAPQPQLEGKPPLNTHGFAHRLFASKHQPSSAPSPASQGCPQPPIASKSPAAPGTWPIPSYPYPLPPLPPTPFLPRQARRAAIPVPVPRKGPGASTAPRGEVPGISGGSDGQMSHSGLLDSRKARSKSRSHFKKL